MLFTIFQPVSHVTCESVNLFYFLWYHCDTLLNCVIQNLSACKWHHMWMCKFIPFFYGTIVILYLTVLLTIFQPVSHITCECVIIFLFLWYHCDTLLNCVIQIFQPVSHITCECVILFFSSMIPLWYFTKLCYSQSFRM